MNDFWDIISHVNFVDASTDLYLMTSDVLNPEYLNQFDSRWELIFISMKITRKCLFCDCSTPPLIRICEKCWKLIFGV
jgi:hypothetical protein